MLIDIYCLVKNRNKELCLGFLDKFLPGRTESSVDYPVPQYSETPNLIYTKTSDLMLFLEKNREEEYSIYWRNCDKLNLVKHGMIFYTNDSHVIFGLSISVSSYKSIEIKRTYLDLNDFVESSPIGCCTSEEPPPLNSVEFKSFCQSRQVLLNM